MRAALIICACAGVTILIGAINIWLGVIAMVIAYPLAGSLLRK